MNTETNPVMKLLERLVVASERIAVALEKNAPIEAPKAKGKGVPEFSDGAGTPGKCKYCKAEIIWNFIPDIGWRPYDPTNPWPRHWCKAREAQDFASTLAPGDGRPPEN